MNAMLKFCVPTLLFISLVILSSSISFAGEKECTRYEFSWNAQPSFLSESVVTIKATPEISDLVINFSNIRTRTRSTEHLRLTTVLSRQFCTDFLRVIALQQHEDNGDLWDGIHVKGHFSAGDNLLHRFSFSFPTRDESPMIRGRADALFSLFETTAVSCELNEYLEQLATYFRFGLPGRIVNNSPLTVRFYGGLSVKSQDDLHALLKRISTMK